MKNLITLTVFIFLIININAQDITIPENIKLVTKEDYQAHETLVLQSIDWLYEIPLAQEKEKRKEINAFLIKWISGSPFVSIELVQGVVPMDDPDCLMAFLSGWTKYSLENNYSTDKVECAMAGVERTISFYEKNKEELGKIPEIEKLIKQKKKEKLKQYIESKF